MSIVIDWPPQYTTQSFIYLIGIKTQRTLVKFNYFNSLIKMAVLPPDPVFSLRSPEMGAVNSLCFHESERLLAGTFKGKVFLWDLQVSDNTTVQ